MKTIAIEYTVDLTMQGGDTVPNRIVLSISELKYDVLMDQSHPLHAMVVGDVESILRQVCNLQGGTLKEWNHTPCM